MALLTYAGVVQDKAVAAAADRFIPVDCFLRVGSRARTSCGMARKPLPYAGADLPRLYPEIAQHVDEHLAIRVKGPAFAIIRNPLPPLMIRSVRSSSGIGLRLPSAGLTYSTFLVWAALTHISACNDLP